MAVMGYGERMKVLPLVLLCTLLLSQLGCPPSSTPTAEDGSAKPSMHGPEPTAPSTSPSASALPATTSAPTSATATSPAPAAAAGRCRDLQVPPTAPPSETRDDSKPFDAGKGFTRLALEPRGLGETAFCGEVEAIRAEGGESVVVVRAPGSEPRQLRVRLQPNIPIPFSVKDTISVRTRTSRRRISLVLEATVADAQGRLLIGYSQKGDTAFAPGWTFAEGPDKLVDPPRGRAARRRMLHVSLAYTGKTARVSSGTWRRLATSDGDWAVTGGAVRWTKGILPPDAASYDYFTIVRLLPRADGSR